MGPTAPNPTAQCESCGYDLGASPPGVPCPECGGRSRCGGLPDRARAGLRTLLISLPLLMVLSLYTAKRGPVGGDATAVEFMNALQACHTVAALLTAAGLGLAAAGLPPSAIRLRRAAWAITAMTIVGIAWASRPGPSAQLPFEIYASRRWISPIPLTPNNIARWMCRAAECGLLPLIMLVCALHARHLGRASAARWISLSAWSALATSAVVALAAATYSIIKTPPPPQRFPNTVSAWTPPPIDTLLKTIGESAAPVFLVAICLAWWSAAYLLGAASDARRQA